VTVYGFTPADLPLILQEFQKCGDILQWGTFGSSPQSNFVHIQYQNTYSAQRALLRTNEQLSSSLIVGVKPLDPMHKQLIEAQERSGDVFGPKVRPAVVPPRPYKVQPVAAAALPQPARTWMQKVSHYVLGI
jgi:nuclear pore complex protein Nup53